MSQFALFREAIKAIVKPLIPSPAIQGTVSEVNKDEKVIAVVGENDSLEIFDVRLMALVADKAGNGITVFPAVGSTVIVAPLNNSDVLYYVCSYSEIESYEITIGEVKFLMDSTGVFFNGGNNGGLINIEEFKVQQEKNNQILSAILSIINGAQIVEPGNGSPSAMQIALKAAFAGKQVGDFSAIEDTKVKH